MADDPGPRNGESIGALAASRAAEYVDIWERAGRRIVDGDYRSEDLVDDWFTYVGMWVRDGVAMATVTWRSASDAQAGDDEADDAQ